MLLIFVTFLSRKFFFNYLVLCLAACTFARCFRLIFHLNNANMRITHAWWKIRSSKLKTDVDEKKTIEKWSLNQLMEEKKRKRKEECTHVIIFNCVIGLACIQIAENELEQRSKMWRATVAFSLCVCECVCQICLLIRIHIACSMVRVRFSFYIYISRIQESINDVDVFRQI